MSLILRGGVVYDVKTRETVIDTDDLQRQKLSLQTQIDNIPAPKARADAETLAVYNALLPKADNLQKKLDELNALITRIDNL
jgi:hypothetical protein